MDITNNIQPTGVEASGERIEVVGGGSSSLEHSVVGALVCLPLLLLAVPAVAFAALGAALFAALAAPTLLVQRVRARHRDAVVANVGIDSMAGPKGRGRA